MNNGMLKIERKRRMEIREGKSQKYTLPFSLSLLLELYNKVIAHEDGKKKKERHVSFSMLIREAKEEKREYKSLLRIFSSLLYFLEKYGGYTPKN